MATISCTIPQAFSSKFKISSSSLPGLSSQLLGTQKRLGWVRPCKIGSSAGYRAKCWFKFGKNGVDAEGAGIYGSQTRDDFDRDDVEQVINPPSSACKFTPIFSLINLLLGTILLKIRLFFYCRCYIDGTFSSKRLDFYETDKLINGWNDMAILHVLRINQAKCLIMYSITLCWIRLISITGQYNYDMNCPCNSCENRYLSILTV